MLHDRRLAVFLWCALAAAPVVAAQSGARPGYDHEYLGAPLPDPVLQYSKETYVQFGCAYCHGFEPDAPGRGHRPEALDHCRP
jgi:hypothetical protein